MMATENMLGFIDMIYSAALNAYLYPFYRNFKCCLAMYVVQQFDTRGYVLVLHLPTTIHVCVSVHVTLAPR